MTNKEAINWIINLTADIGKIEYQSLWHYEQALSEIREMLEIEAERTGRWIPVSERLPEDGQTVIFTYDKDKVECGWFNQTRCVCNNDSYFISEFEFTAWMPLPEPYKDGEHEDDYDYERASDMRDYCERYEPTYNPEDGSM